MSPGSICKLKQGDLSQTHSSWLMLWLVLLLDCMCVASGSFGAGGVAPPNWKLRPAKKERNRERGRLPLTEYNPRAYVKIAIYLSGYLTHCSLKSAVIYNYL